MLAIVPAQPCCGPVQPREGNRLSFFGFRFSSIQKWNKNLLLWKKRCARERWNDSFEMSLFVTSIGKFDWAAAHQLADSDIKMEK
jgi:hypothetical protein